MPFEWPLGTQPGQAFGGIPGLLDPALWEPDGEFREATSAWKKTRSPFLRAGHQPAVGPGKSLLWASSAQTAPQPEAGTAAGAFHTVLCSAGVLPGPTLLLSKPEGTQPTQRGSSPRAPLMWAGGIRGAGGAPGDIPPGSGESTLMFSACLSRIPCMSSTLEPLGCSSPGQRSGG